MAQRAEMKLAQRLHETLEALAAARPMAPRTIWSEAKLEAFECDVGVPLHDDVRAWLLVVGEGGSGFWSGTPLALDTLEPRRRTALARPFPLEKGWVDPSLTAELKAAKLATKYKKYLYDLPPRTSVDDGVVPLGCTTDGRGLLLVVNGAAGGTVWSDNRGNDYGEVLPVGRLLTLQLEWASAQLEEARQARALEEALRARDLGALVKRFGDEALEAFSARARQQACVTGAASDDVAWFLFEHASKAGKHAAAGQALVLAGDWRRLETFSQECLELLAAGKLTATRQAELTFKTHLAIASVKLKKAFTTTWPSAFSEYYHLGDR